MPYLAATKQPGKSSTYIQIITLDTEHAWIAADLPEGSRIIALGVNQLKPGMIVQALTR